MKKLIRITTIPLSLEKLLENQGQYFSKYYNVTFISSQGKELKAVGEKQGVATFTIPLTRIISPFHDLRSVYLLYRFLKRERPEIVHTHTPKAGIVGMLAARLAGVPIRLHTIAGLPLMEASGLKRCLLLGVERLTYYCATKVYPNSEGLLRFVLGKRLTVKEKLKVIGKGSSNGIDTAYFSKKHITESQIKQWRKSLDLKSTDFIYCFVGRLVGDKGINELISAFCVVQKEIPIAKLLLVGPYESDLDPLNAQTQNIINTNPNILTTGYQADIRPYLALSNVFVFPSYREGFPNVVLQAAAMEVPCIVSDINGCNEIIQEQVNGGIVPPKQVSPLVEKMKYFYTHPDRLNEFIQKSKERVHQYYDRKQFWNLLLNEYHHQEKNVPNH